jgi:hypothetical protein
MEMGTEMGTMTKKGHTTHTQPHESLLVGWIGDHDDNDDDEQQQQYDRMMTDNQEATRMRETE